MSPAKFSSAMPSRKQTFWTLNILFLLQWIILGSKVFSRSAWVLENLLVLALFIPIIIAFRKGCLSRTAYLMVFIFASIHNIGAHYTYSLAPYDRWLDSMLGFTLSSAFGWSRNHYDRFVHFLFGLLLFLPFKELVGGKFRLGSRWSPFLVVLIVIGWSTAYELLEWTAALIFSEGAGPDYVGTQGDLWDAQKDQALAIAGALLAWALDNTMIAQSPQSRQK